MCRLWHVRASKCAIICTKGNTVTVREGCAMLYAIHEGNYPTLEKKLNRIARKCAKLGNSFTFERKGEEVREHKKHLDSDMVEYHKFILVEVEGTAKVDNWEFVATLDIREGGNVIRRCNNDIEVPEHFRNSANVCEHCNTKRQRHNLYLIRNTETGEFKQVGGNCLALYTHGLDAEYVASWLDGIEELEKYDGKYCYMKDYLNYSISEVLAYANAIVEKMGYFNADSVLSTKSLVLTMLRRDMFANTLEKRVCLVNDELKACRFDVRFTTDDFLAALSNDDSVHEIIDYYKSCEGNNEFMHNVKTILANDYCKFNDLGYLCYLPVGYAKHQQREIEHAQRQKESVNSNYFGEVGKRYRDVSVIRADKVTSWLNDYGVVHMYRIIIEGAILIWKTSKYYDGDDFHNITFTVKEHKDYNEQKQTVVTRCKVA